LSKTDPGVSADGLGWLLFVALLLALGVGWLLRRTYRSLRARWRGRRAVRAERLAEKLLVRHGYRVVERQATTRYRLRCDDRALPVELRADLLLERAGERFVADVKSGPQATMLRTAATRRQLLEYWLAYDVDGVLLVDMEARRIVRVAFEPQRRDTSRRAAA
jgi:hypothetical protein